MTTFGRTLYLQIPNRGFFTYEPVTFDTELSILDYLSMKHRTS